MTTILHEWRCNSIILNPVSDVPLSSVRRNKVQYSDHDVLERFRLSSDNKPDQFKVNAQIMVNNAVAEAVTLPNTRTLNALFCSTRISSRRARRSSNDGGLFRLPFIVICLTVNYVLSKLYSWVRIECIRKQVMEGCNGYHQTNQ